MSSQEEEVVYIAGMKLRRRKMPTNDSLNQSDNNDDENVDDRSPDDSAKRQKLSNDNNDYGGHKQAWTPQPPKRKHRLGRVNTGEKGNKSVDATSRQVGKKFLLPPVSGDETPEDESDTEWFDVSTGFEEEIEERQVNNDESRLNLNESPSVSTRQSETHQTKRKTLINEVDESEDQDDSEPFETISRRVQKRLRKCKVRNEEKSDQDQRDYESIYAAMEEEERRNRVDDDDQDDGQSLEQEKEQFQRKREAFHPTTDSVIGGDLEVLITCKGGTAVRDPNGFIYHHERTNHYIKTNIFRCSKKMVTACLAWIHVKDMKLLKLVNSHNHPAPAKGYSAEEQRDACTIRQVIKEQALAQPDFSPQELIIEVLAQFAEEGIPYVGDKKYLLQMVRNTRLQANEPREEPRSIGVAEVVKTIKGKDALKCPLGYVYNLYRHNRMIGTSVYICSKRPKCSARIHAKGKEIVKIVKTHNHGAIFD